MRHLFIGGRSGAAVCSLFRKRFMFFTEVSGDFPVACPRGTEKTMVSFLKRSCGHTPPEDRILGNEKDLPRSGRGALPIGAFAF